MAQHRAGSKYRPTTTTDRIYLLAHDDRTGKPRVSPAAVALAVAGGVLGDLMASRWLTLYNGALYAAGTDQLPDGPAYYGTTVAHVRQDHAPLAEWLRFLAMTIVGDVAAYLVEIGVLRAIATHRILWFKAETTYEPVDMTTAYLPLMEMSKLFLRNTPVSQADAFLAGLVHAAGLSAPVWGVMLPDQLEYWLTTLPNELQDIIHQTATIVGHKIASGHI